MNPTKGNASGSPELLCAPRPIHCGPGSRRGRLAQGTCGAMGCGSKWDGLGCGSASVGQRKGGSYHLCGILPLVLFTCNHHKAWISFHHLSSQSWQSRKAGKDGQERWSQKALKMIFGKMTYVFERLGTLLKDVASLSLSCLSTLWCLSKDTKDAQRQTRRFPKSQRSSDWASLHSAARGSV